MSEQESWKSKYRALTQELEQCQQHNQLSESQLKRLLTTMTLALQGQEPRLDKSLLQLRLQLQDGAVQPNQLKPVSDQLERDVRELDNQREKQARRLLGTLRSWIRQLRLLSPGATEELENFEQRGHDAVEHPWQIPELLDAMLDFQQPWLDKAQQVLETEVELNEATLLKDQQLLLQRVQVELQRLLEQFSVPLSARRQLHQLGELLETDITMQQLPELLHAIVELVRAAFSDNSEEFENYLRSLSVKLTEVQHFLAQQSREEKQVGASQHALEAQMRSDVKKLSATVDSTNDIGHLKTAVSEQLVGIVQVMDEMRRQEDRRDQQLRHNYSALIEKVELMEHETRKAKMHIEEERHRARTDPLTGLPNRTAYDEQISHELERWNRYQHGFSIAVADLDHFKKINDSYGHLAGDKVLRLVGRIMHKNSRRTDVIARYGGEEFVIIMPGTEADAAVTATEKLRKAIEASPFNFNGRPVGITMSFGVTQIKTGDDLDSLFSRADKALYQAKQKGRNQTSAG